MLVCFWCCLPLRDLVETLRKMGKLHRVVVRGPTVPTLTRSLEGGPPGPGRPTPGDHTLGADRDALVWLLSVAWPDIGWELPRATTLEELRGALEPWRGHPSEQTVVHFLRPTSVGATPEEIRAMRKTLGEEIKRLRGAQEWNDRCLETSHTLELAMNDVQGDQRQAMAMELFGAWGENKKAREALKLARETETKLTEELRDKEAGFAQAELLDYITKKKYARNPLGLANAMAGLPDLGWPQSHERCSKMTCGQWPAFQFQIVKIIATIWNRRGSYSELPIVQLFRQEIDNLSRNVIVSYQPAFGSPAINAKRENPLRAHLADNWRSLRLALEEVVGLETHPDRMPFLIASRFAKNLAKPRTPQDLVHNAREKIL
jgi:hypothetical protein